MIKKKAPESPCKFFWGCATVFIDKEKNDITDFLLSNVTGSSGPDEDCLVTHQSTSVKLFLEKLEWDRKKSYKNCLRQRVKTRGKTRLSETEPQTALVGTEYQKRYCLLANRPLEADLVRVYQCPSHKDFSDKTQARGSNVLVNGRRIAGSNPGRPKKSETSNPSHRYRCVLRERDRVRWPRPLQPPVRFGLSGQIRSIWKRF